MRGFFFENSENVLNNGKIA